jgi:hypothetical protein|tara:strand:- start:189 stop:608 length:420 start_codon:yes stop_codon:yes gene_type:complete
MASITRTNGNAFGAVSHDRGLSGLGNISADQLVTINGPVCDYFKIIIQDVSGDVNDIRPELGSNEVVETVLKEIQTLANVEVYQVEGDTTGQISVAVYPAGAWSTTSLQTAVRALGATVGTNTMDCTGSTVTTPGFELV